MIVQTGHFFEQGITRLNNSSFKQFSNLKMSFRGRVCVKDETCLLPRTTRTLPYTRRPMSSRHTSWSSQQVPRSTRLEASGSSDVEVVMPSPLPETDDSSLQEADVVIIGSGIGGLSCAALLANYGVKVRPFHVLQN